MSCNWPIINSLYKKTLTTSTTEYNAFNCFPLVAPSLLVFLSFFLFLVGGADDVSGGGRPAWCRPGGGRDRRRSTHRRHILRRLLDFGNRVQAFASRIEGSLHSRPPRPRRGSRIHWLPSFFFPPFLFLGLKRHSWFFMVFLWFIWGRTCYSSVSSWYDFFFVCRIWYQPWAGKGGGWDSSL